MLFGDFEKGKLVLKHELNIKVIHQFLFNSFFNENHELTYNNKETVKSDLFNIFDNTSYVCIDQESVFQKNFNMNLQEFLNITDTDKVVFREKAQKEKSDFKKADEELSKSIKLFKTEIEKKQEKYEEEKLNYDIAVKELEQSQSPDMKKTQLKNQDEFIGKYTEDGKKDGFGTYKFKSGDEEFRGKFEKGKMQGFGKYKFKSGYEFDGDFDNNKINGIGTLYTKVIFLNKILRTAKRNMWVSFKTI